MPRFVHSSSSLDSTALQGADAVVQLTSDSAETGDVLVVTHTADGEILTLHWPQAEDCMNCQEFVGQSVEALFGPVAVAPYLLKSQQILKAQIPESFPCVVRCGQQPLSFEFLLSPLPLNSTDEAGNPVIGLVGVGRRVVPEVSQLSDVRFVRDNGANGSYYALFSQVASNIRKTLDLPTIWQQTVNGLGNMLGLDRCLVCDYSQAMQTVTVVAEYHQASLHPCLGRTFDLGQKSDFLDTLQSLEPVISDFERDEDERPYTVLTVATC
ncbi:MAG: histidine kinase, partial [Cyanobacteria bacterium J06632_3]